MPQQGAPQPGMPQQGAPQPQGPQMPFRHGGLAEIPVHNIGHEDRYASGGIIAFDQGGSTHDFMDRPGAHTIGQLPTSNPSTNPASTPTAGGTPAPTSTPPTTAPTPAPAPTPATGQVSTTANAQGLYTDVVGGHTYSQATPWQQYQIDALNKEYATQAPAPAPAPAPTQGIASLGHGHHPHAFTGDREKRLANQQQFYINQYGGNWQQAMQNQKAFNAASAAENDLYASGKITVDKLGHSFMDGKPYTPITSADISRYASYGGKELNPNAGQVYSDGSPVVTETLNPQPNTGSMTGFQPQQRPFNAGQGPMAAQQRAAFEAQYKAQNPNWHPGMAAPNVAAQNKAYMDYMNTVSPYSNYKMDATGRLLPPEHSPGIAPWDPGYVAWSQSPEGKAATAKANAYVANPTPIDGYMSNYAGFGNYSFDKVPGKKRGGAIKHFAAGSMPMPDIDDTSASENIYNNYEETTPSIAPENIAAAEQAAATGDPAAVSLLGKIRSALNAGRKFNPKIPTGGILSGGLKAIPGAVGRTYLAAFPYAAAARGAGDIYQGVQNIRSGDLAAGYTPTEDYYRMFGMDPKTHVLGNNEFGTTAGEVGVRALGELIKYGTFGIVQPRGDEPVVPKPTATDKKETKDKDSSPIDMSQLPAYKNKDSGIGALTGLLGTPKTPKEELDYIEHLRGVADDKRKIADVPYADLLRQRHEADLAMGLGNAAREGIQHADKMTQDLIDSKPHLLAMDRLKGFAAMGMAAGARSNQAGYVGPGIKGALTAAFQGLSAWSDSKEKTLNNYNNAMSKLYDDRYKYAAALENDNRAEMKDAESDIKTRVKDAEAAAKDLAAERALAARDINNQRTEGVKLAAQLASQERIARGTDPAKPYQEEILKRERDQIYLDPNSPAGKANQAMINQLSGIVQNYNSNYTRQSEIVRMQLEQKIQHDLQAEFSNQLSPAVARVNELVKKNKMSVEAARQQVLQERMQEAKVNIGIGGGGMPAPTNAIGGSNGWGNSEIVG